MILEQDITGSCVELFNTKIRVDDYPTYNSNFSLQQTMSYVGSIKFKFTLFPAVQIIKLLSRQCTKNKSFSNHIILIIVKM